MSKCRPRNYYFAGRHSACCDEVDYAELTTKIATDLFHLIKRQVCYRESCKPIEPETRPAMRSDKVTVSKPYLEKNRHGKERYRVIVKTPTGRTSAVYSTLTEANRDRLRLEKHHRQDCEKSIGELIEEYKGYCLTDLGYRPRTARIENERLNMVFESKPQLRLSTLTPVKAEAMMKVLWVRRSKKNGQPLAAATHRHDIAILQRFGKWACKTKYMRENPFTGLIPPGKPNVGKVHLTADERTKWVSACQSEITNGSKLAIAALFCLYRGTRADEILLRRVSDVDDAGTKLIISSAKTKAGNRRLGIPEPLREYFAALCHGKSPTEFLFAPAKPGLRNANWSSSLLRVVQRICRAANVQQISTHSLRGMNAEMQLEGGQSEDIVARTLGHTNISMTMRHYVNQDVQDSIAAKKVDKKLHDKRSGDTEKAALLSAKMLLGTLSSDVVAALRTVMLEAHSTA